MFKIIILLLEENKSLQKPPIWREFCAKSIKINNEKFLIIKILNLRTFFFEFTFAQKIEQFESITQKIEQQFSV